jgi:nucleoside-diphosphate-sugar epimerase
MRSCLIGHTGFVGGNLANQHPFDEFYNSKNIEAIRERKFDFLAISGMPAAMWRANQDPAGDRVILDRLVGCLRQVQAERVVVVSTVAVYPTPIEVDEATPIDPREQTPYGRHRYLLEQFATEHFPQVLIVRLPGLFGNGLRKNALYDLLHDHEVHKIHAEAVYQFYNLDRLGSDISTALNAGLTTINFATEPVAIGEVARQVFERELADATGTLPAKFDMRTRHAALWGGRNGYLYDRRQVLNELRAFVRNERVVGANA